MIEFMNETEITWFVNAQTDPTAFTAVFMSAGKLSLNVPVDLIGQWREDKKERMLFGINEGAELLILYPLMEDDSKSVGMKIFRKDGKFNRQPAFAMAKTLIESGKVKDQFKYNFTYNEKKGWWEAKKEV